MTATATTFRVSKVCNAKTWARKFQARLLEPGIISYEDVKQGKAILRKETIDRHINSFVGRPLILTNTYGHKDVSPETMERDAAGYITNVWYNSEDNWYWCEGTVHSDEAKEAIANVGKVSCGYDITEMGGGGQYHCIPYDYEIKGFSGEHLAIVKKPRYENATIRLNCKSNQSTTMFKWFKKKPADAGSQDAASKAASGSASAAPGQDDAARANAVASAAADSAEDISPETELLVGEAKVKLGDVIAGYQAHAARANATDGEIPADATVDIEGEQVAVSELIAGHKARKNAKPADAKPDAPASKSSGHLFRIVTARDNAAAAGADKKPLEGVDTLEERLARGKALY